MAPKHGLDPRQNVTKVRIGAVEIELERRERREELEKKQAAEVVADKTEPIEKE